MTRISPKVFIAGDHSNWAVLSPIRGRELSKSSLAQTVYLRPWRADNVPGVPWVHFGQVLRCM